MLTTSASRLTPVQLREAATPMLGDARWRVARTLTRIHHVVYDATSLRGVLILYSQEEAEQSCAGMGGTWFDQYTLP